MLDGFKEAVAEFRHGQLALGPINLPLLAFKTRQLPPGNVPIGGL